MYIADTLSWAYLLNPDTSVFMHCLESIDHTISVSLNAECLQQLKHASLYDSVLQWLRETREQSRKTWAYDSVLWL